jgi:hypothetical protein
VFAKTVWTTISQLKMIDWVYCLLWLKYSERKKKKLANELILFRIEMFVVTIKNFLETFEVITGVNQKNVGHPYRAKKKSARKSTHNDNFKNVSWPCYSSKLTFLILVFTPH